MKNKILNTFLLYINIFLILGTIPFLSKINSPVAHIFVTSHLLVYYITIYICILAFVLNMIKGSNNFTIPLLLFLFFIYITIHSLFVSSALLDSLFRIVVLFGTCIYALSLIKRYKFIEILYISMWVCLIVNIVMGIFAIYDPILAYEAYKDRLVMSGAFPNKNNFATFMLFSIIVNLSYLSEHTKMKSISIFSLMLSTFFLFSSGSVTSILTLLIILSIFYINKRLKFKLNFVLVGLILNLLVYFIVNLGAIFEDYVHQVLGRDLTLTGRTYIWSAILEEVNTGLFWGYGYGTFWGYNSLLESQIIANYTNKIGGVIVSGAHNGFLELILQIGIIGVLLFLVIILYSGKKLYDLRHLSFFKFSSFFYIYILIYFITERSFWNMGYQTLYLFLIILLTTVKKQE